MIEPLVDKLKAGAFVLDPSAGKGNILDSVKHYYNWERKWQKRLFAVEIDSDLQSILKQKEYQVIGDDWMKYSSHYHFDIILGNPPFQSGEDHLLKAWDVLKGGDIVFLLNAETIRNPYTQKRQLLEQIIQQHGSVEFLGSCFDTAERKTNVEVAMVRLHKKAADRFEFKGFTGQKEFDPGESLIENLPARRNLIGSLVSSYNDSAAALEAKILADSRLNVLSNDLWKGFHDETMKNRMKDAKMGPEYYNAYMAALNAACWHQIFERTNLKAIMTSKVIKDFQAFQQQQGSVEFTEENISAFFEMLVMNRTDILERCVVDVFDRMTSYAVENKVHWEGWVTNDTYKVNEKCIMPYFIGVATWNYQGQYVDLSVNWGKRDELLDIDRALCLVTGKRFESATDPVTGESLGIKTLLDALEQAVKPCKNLRPGSVFVNEGESEFFTFKFWKKGTLHIKFKDRQVLDMFNQRAAGGKNWIPAPKAKRKA